VIVAFEEAKTASKGRLVQLIEEHKLTREMVPTKALNDSDVWAALLPHMGITALIRNLGKMTSVGVLKALTSESLFVSGMIGTAAILRKGRVHPMTILNALRVYAAGHGEKGSLTWKPVQKIVDALDAAFYLSFGNVEPTGKNVMLALDVSGSMSAHIGGTSLSCREAAGAMALITANVEKNHLITGFTAGFGRSQWASYGTALQELAISPKQRLDDVVKYLGSLKFGGTDCALPMVYATEQELDVDGFVIYTDSETWAGNIQPVQALAKYRKAAGKADASCTIVGMTASGFSIADPKDPRMLDVVGFDTATPQVISEFVKGA
jgi:60 kDa SS-A/Ro ribonucleoprotein